METLSARGTNIVVGVVDVVVLTPATSRGVASRSRARRHVDWRVLTLRRAAATRCTGAWEIVHGRIEPGETPTVAARREVLEEIGCETRALYSIAVSPFYLHHSNTVQLAVVFAAVVDPLPIALGMEHDRYRWRTPRAARRALAWPSEHRAVDGALHLLAGGDAGPLEDVLRIP